MEHCIEKFDAFYGLDAHQDTISISRILPYGKAEYLTTTPNQTRKIKAFFREERKRFKRILSCYEAGGCGYTIYDTLTELGIQCEIIAPTHLPRHPVKKRHKNDKNDSLALAEYLMLGLLTPIYIAPEEIRAYRELTRYRKQLVRSRTAAKNKVTCFLRRYGKKFTLGKTAWTKTYWRWLQGVVFPNVQSQWVFTQLIGDVRYLDESVAKVTHRLEAVCDQWEKAPVVRALTAIRGIDLVIAMSIVAEVGTFQRFEKPDHFASYLGLCPSEYSSGERKCANSVDPNKVKRGGITKAGNPELRALLVEASWPQRRPPRVSPELKKRREGIPSHLTAHSQKAQERLHKRYRHLTEERGKPPKLAIVAVARELACFICAIAKDAEHLSKQHLENQKDQPKDAA